MAVKSTQKILEELDLLQISDKADLEQEKVDQICDYWANKRIKKQLLNDMSGEYRDNIFFMFKEFVDKKTKEALALLASVCKNRYAPQELVKATYESGDETLMSIEVAYHAVYFAKQFKLSNERVRQLFEVHPDLLSKIKVESQSVSSRFKRFLLRSPFFQKLFELLHVNLPPDFTVEEIKAFETPLDDVEDKEKDGASETTHQDKSHVTESFVSVGDRKTAEPSQDKSMRQEGSKDNDLDFGFSSIQHDKGQVKALEPKASEDEQVKSLNNKSEASPKVQHSGLFREPELEKVINVSQPASFPHVSMAISKAELAAELERSQTPKKIQTPKKAPIQEGVTRISLIISKLELEQASSYLSRVCEEDQESVNEDISAPTQSSTPKALIDVSSPIATTVAKNSSITKTPIVKGSPKEAEIVTRPSSTTVSVAASPSKPVSDLSPGLIGSAIETMEPEVTASSTKATDLNDLGSGVKSAVKDVNASAAVSSPFRLKGSRRTPRRSLTPALFAAPSYSERFDSPSATQPGVLPRELVLDDDFALGLKNEGLLAAGASLVGSSYSLIQGDLDSPIRGSGSHGFDDFLGRYEEEVEEEVEVEFPKATAGLCLALESDHAVEMAHEEGNEEEDDEEDQDQEFQNDQEEAEDEDRGLDEIDIDNSQELRKDVREKRTVPKIVDEEDMALSDIDIDNSEELKVGKVLPEKRAEDEYEEEEYQEEEELESDSPFTV